MKPFFFILLFGCFAPCVSAQDDPLALIGRQPAVRVSIMPITQVWKGEGDDEFFGELSIPIALQIPLGSKASLSLRGGGAYAVGRGRLKCSEDLSCNFDHGEILSGLADAQAALSVRQNLGPAVLLLSLSANLPSGKKGLTDAEFSTSVQLSQNILRFQMPSFGQGFGLSPGLLLALPVGDRLAFGIGATYQVKGAYRPLQSFTEDYDPGDEILVTGGVDLRLGPTTFVSSDVIYTRYERDKLGDEEVFGAGDKIVVTAQFRHSFNFHQLWVLGRFRSRDKNELPVDGILIEEAQKTIPDQRELIAQLRLRLGRSVYMRLMGEGRLFDAIGDAGGISLYGVGLGPEFVLSPSVRIPLRFKYFFGDFQGVEAGLGLVLTL